MLLERDTTMAKPKTVKQVLVKARKLIAEVGWCRGSLAKDVRGRPVRYPFRGAAHYCSVGAISKACDLDANVYLPAINALRITLDDSIGRWNDRQTDKRTVLRVFDKAIKAL